MKKIQPYLKKMLSNLQTFLSGAKVWLKKIPPYGKKLLVWLKKYLRQLAPLWKKLCSAICACLEKVKPYLEKLWSFAKNTWIKIQPYLKKGLPYATVALLSAVITLAITITAIPSQPEQSKLDALEQLIVDCFIGEKDQTAMEDAAANAMVEALGDRWSYYIPAESYAAYLEEMKNEYVGIGITISSRADGIGLDIIGVTAGGPAENAGVLKDDVIIGVDGTSIAGMDVNSIKKMIQGKANTTVKLTLLRGKTELQLEIIRQEIKTPVAMSQMLDNQIGLITIVNFNANCASETIAAIEKLISEGAQKLIFDVRNNPGGYASEMVAVLDRLLPEGKLFTTVDYAGQESVSTSDATWLDMPMAVVVNAASYSAAEFFAAAMSEYDAAVVVGEQTCGKGYFQNTFLLPDGSAVGLSIGKYYTPEGNSLADVGITPQVMVPVTEKIAAEIAAGTLEPMQDPQILAAIDALN